MAHFTWVLLLLLLSCSNCTQIPKELILDKDEGSKALLVDGYMVSPVRIEMDFGSIHYAAPVFRDIFVKKCAELESVKRQKRHVPSFDLEMTTSDVAETTGTVVMGVILAPLAAGGALGLARVNERDIATMNSNMKAIYVSHLGNLFEKQVDSLIFDGILTGQFLDVMTKRLQQAAHFNSTAEVRSRVKVAIDACEGNVIIGSAKYADPHTSAHGYLYRIADPGFVNIKESVYTHHLLPREVFVSVDGQLSEIDNCSHSVGLHICEKKEMAESTCSITEFSTTCPRLVQSLKGRDVVRRINDKFIIASKKLAVIVRDRNSTTRTFALNRRGLTVMRINVNEQFVIGNNVYHGLTIGDTVSVSTDMTEIEHEYPSDMNVHQHKEIRLASNEQFYQKKIKKKKKKKTTFAFETDILPPAPRVQHP